MTKPEHEHDDTLPEALAGEIGAAMDAAALPSAQREAVRARLLDRARRAPPRGLTTLRADEGQWQPFLPRVSIKVLHRDGDVQSYLLKLDPGAIVVPHEHPHDEECVVLEGEVRIGDLVARRGDFHLAPRGVPHAPIRSDTGALLYLRGAVPHAAHIRWRQAATYAALAPEQVRRFVERWGE